jgi:adenosine deaminase
LIASVNRHEDISIATEVVHLAIDRKHHGIVGLDLAGNEAQFSGMGFLGIFKEAREAGMHITIHAGEWGRAENVLNAILYLSAERIGHGVRVLEDPEVTCLARDRGIPFEVCVTSNYQSGVIPSLTVHPLSRMIAHGLNVTINTDDPSISQITLGDEYRLVCENLGLNLGILRERVLAAAQAAFLPEEEKAALISQIDSEFPIEKTPAVPPITSPSETVIPIDESLVEEKPLAETEETSEEAEETEEDTASEETETENTDPAQTDDSSFES